MNNKRYAFTIAEILISFTIIGVIIVSTVVSTLSSSGISRKKVMLQSQSFYESIYKTYFKITTTGSSPFRIVKSDEETLVKKLAEYIDMTSFSDDCSDLKIGDLDTKYCAKLISGIRMGAKIDKTCSTDLDVYEYLKPEDIKSVTNNISTRKVRNVCGYIIYNTKKSNKVFKEDSFIIPLKRHSVE